MRVKKRFIISTMVAMGIMMAATIMPTFATVATTPMNLGILAIRQSGYGYEVRNEKVWKIVSYPNNGAIEGQKPDYSQPIYCIKGGQGFYGTDGADLKNTVPYNVYYDMKKEANTMPANLRQQLPKTEENYNALLWIFDNMYLAANPVSERNALLSKAGIPVDSTTITNDDIEVVQQVALWYFTNASGENGNFNVGKTLPEVYINELGSTAITTPISDKDRYRAQDMQTLYSYFINNAVENGKKYDANKSLPSPITLDDTKLSLEKENGNMIIGPFKMTKNTDSAYELTQSVTGKKDVAGEEIAITGYTVLRSDKTPLLEGESLEDLVGSNFYIAVPEVGNEEYTTIRFSIGVKYSESNVMYWTNSTADPASIQPVAIPQKAERNYAKGLSINIEKPEQIFDLALRKTITEVIRAGVATEITNRYPTVDVNGEVNFGPKDAIAVRRGDIVTYTLTIYNQGNTDGYASLIYDDIPEGLEFLNNEFNATYGWILTDDLKAVTTDYLSKDKATLTGRDNLLKAFDKDTMSTPDSRKIKLQFKVSDTAPVKTELINTAEIANDTDTAGNPIDDIDSITGNHTSTKWQDEDDLDIEKVKLEQFDLALRKTIVKVQTGTEEKTVSNRDPQIGKDGSIGYGPKDPVAVMVGDIVTYRLRVYNEGDIAGYAEEVKDDMPQWLEYLPEDETNVKYGWKEVTNTDGKVELKTDYLSQTEGEIAGRDNLLKAFDKVTMKEPDYRDILVVFKVKEPDTLGTVIINTAEISADSGDDIDSTPDNNVPGEDDIDIEKVKIEYFDLALRKFITKVNDEDVVDRYPLFKITEDGKYIYEHTKDPVLVKNNDVVIYTLRVFNEGTQDGYAKIVTDDVPEGLEFLPEHVTNQTYKWALAADGKTISTDYLSKETEETTGENLIKGFDKQAYLDGKVKEPSYKEIKIAFKVTEPQTSDRILINTAEIADDSDANGDKVTDIDSTPGNNNTWGEEDDLDKEFLKVQYFDLALKKWVSSVILIEDGKQTVSPTGHTGDENPEPVVKVELNRKKLSAITVKFEYTIKVTNEGEIEGYVKAIKDYIPEGLKFVAEDNPDWKELSNGIIETRKLENTLLKPGESGTVNVVLTWINNANNLGLKVNTAEISEDYNESHTPDIDSTPDNKVPGEDDIDDAPVLLSIATGGGMPSMYVGLTATVLVMLGGGIYLIKRYVL